MKLTTYLPAAALFSLCQACTPELKCPPEQKCTDGGATASSYSPISISWDLHCDPFSPIQPVDLRRATFRRQLDNAEWLLNTVEPYGAKISFLAVGEFYEFCVEESEKTRCLPLLKRLHASGGILGTHQHAQRYRGPHDWADVTAMSPAGSEKAIWDDGKRFTEEAVRQALGLSDAAALSAVNAACASHLPLDIPKQNTWLEEYGYTILEGGGDQDLVAYFGHVPRNPFRRGATTISENLSAKFVTVPQGMVLGQNGDHKGIWQDGRAPHKKSEFLSVYVEWLHRQRTGASPKTWSFGWGLHTQDLAQNGQSRKAVTELIPWLKQQMIDRPSVAGNTLARFASYIEVRDEYIAWEKANPGVSSFNYPLAVKDYSAYPYLEWANRYLHALDFEEELATPEGVRLFRLSGSGHALLLAIADEVTATVDAQSLGAAKVRRVDLATGQSSEVSAAAAPVGPGSMVLCVPSECDAILAL